MDFTSFVASPIFISVLALILTLVSAIIVFWNFRYITTPNVYIETGQGSFTVGQDSMHVNEKMAQRVRDFLSNNGLPLADDYRGEW